MKDSTLVVEIQAAIFPPLLPLPVHCSSVSSCCTFNAKNSLLDILTAFKELFVCQEVLRTCSANIEQQAESELSSLETMCRSPQNLREDGDILNIASQRRISNLIKAKERRGDCSPGSTQQKPRKAPAQGKMPMEIMHPKPDRQVLGSLGIKSTVA